MVLEAALAQSGLLDAETPPPPPPPPTSVPAGYSTSPTRRKVSEIPVCQCERTIRSLVVVNCKVPLLFNCYHNIISKN